MELEGAQVKTEGGWSSCIEWAFNDKVQKILLTLGVIGLLALGFYWILFSKSKCKPKHSSHRHGNGMTVLHSGVLQLSSSGSTTDSSSSSSYSE